MKKELNWKDIGRFFSVLLNLFAIIRDTFTAQGIGLEIIGWIAGEGKDAFVEKFLKPLGEQFLATARVIVVDENTIRVNLDAPPVLPFAGATVKANKGGGWVTVQKRSDGLYVDNRKVILYLSEHQQGGQSVSGHELSDEVKNLAVLHPNILDALCDLSHLIPEDYKRVENRFVIPLIFFWAVIFVDSDGCHCVRYLCRDSSGYFRLSHGWGDTDPAAVLE